LILILFFGVRNIKGPQLQYADGFQQLMNFLKREVVYWRKDGFGEAEYPATFTG